MTGENDKNFNNQYNIAIENARKVIEIASRESKESKENGEKK